MRHAFALLALLAALPCRSSNDAAAERERPLIHALQALGVKYLYGGRSLESGFDCSGLVAYVFERTWGMLLPPGTEALSKVGRSAPRSANPLAGL